MGGDDFEKRPCAFAIISFTLGVLWVIMHLMNDLFSNAANRPPAPLADLLRPKSLDEVVGHLKAVATIKTYLNGQLPNLIFWGPPGVGKTTLARIVARESGLYFEQISAIFSGVADLKKIFEAANLRHEGGKRTLLFVDEIHRFNKSQQDAFLPVMENGVISLIGATTENPSFELNAALMSRAQVVRLERLGLDDLGNLLSRAQSKIGKTLPLNEAARLQLLELADGDGRALLNMIETLAASGLTQIDEEALGHVLSRRVAQYDKSGDAHYNLISALHKSVRGSDPDAALYWFARMLEGGEDPNYLGRRILRMAVEDIGLADPQAQSHALHAWQTYERLGSPEGELALAQAVIYLALAPKSNSAYNAYKQARRLAKETGSKLPPKHILNAPTKMMKEQGYGKGYAYDHDDADGFSGQNYFPEDMRRPVVYTPHDRGFERELLKRVDYFAKLRSKKQGSET